MSPPRVPGLPGYRLPSPSDPDDETPLRRVRSSIDALGVRLEAVEASVGDLPQMRADLADINLGVKAFKGVLSHVFGKQVVAIIATAAASFGAAKLAEAPSTPEKTVVTKSATTIKLEACQLMQLGELRDQCIINLIGEMQQPRP